MPKVSILIPSYKPEYFRSALTSAIAQTWADKEIIVSDDCPNSEIYDICRDFIDVITYVRNPNPGLGGRNNVLNLCKLASGDYLKFLCDDDLLHPFCVQMLLDPFSRSEAPSFTFSPRTIIDEKNGFIETPNHFGLRSPRIIERRELVRLFAAKFLNPIGELTTILFRRDALFAASGAFSFATIDNVTLTGLGDVALMAQLLEKGPAVGVPHVLSYFRRHGTSNSNPEMNSDWPLLMTDWRHIIDYAANNNLFSEREAKRAREDLILHLKSWSIAHSTHMSDFQRVIAALEAEVASCESVSEAQTPSLFRRLFSGLVRPRC
jgi:glycosyltransferase involved in cell wall biosynthesis